MRKVVIDTNVFISGIVYGGKPRKLIDLWLAKQFVLCLSPELKAEILGKLERKFLLPKESIISLVDALDTLSMKYIPRTKIDLCTDPKDNFLLELAEEANAEYLVSGDGTVQEIKKYKRTKIISPAKFLGILK